MKNFRDRIETTSIKPEIRNGKKVWVLYVNGKDRMQTETDSIKELLKMMLETDFEKAKWLTS